VDLLGELHEQHTGAEQLANRALVAAALGRLTTELRLAIEELGGVQ
jgi:hypothetical protein